MFTAVVSAFVILVAETAAFGYCPQGWIKHKKKCYVIFPYHRDRNTANKAQQFCHGHGGTLANLKTKELYNMAMELLHARKGSSVFIGLYDINQEGDFRWGDGDRTKFTMWLPGEPNDQSALFQSEECVYMDINGLWNDINCDSSTSGNRDILCEKSAKELIHVNSTKWKQCRRP